MFNLNTREHCEQFQMLYFGISCATCERADEECPWHRRDDETEVGSEEFVAIAACPVTSHGDVQHSIAGSVCLPEACVAKPSDSRARTKWVDEDIRLLKKLERSGTATGAIALRLGRTKAAISIKASKLGIKLGETVVAT